ncbi:hypothetical protein TURU_133008 [Turdus rufiventris]|nr:hypothetical protein TURU_133008 [Turdus rufiventris]
MDLGSAGRRAGAAPAGPGSCRPVPSACCCCLASLLDVNSWLLFYGFLYLALYAQVSQSKSCDKISCFSGHCVNSTCVCDQGWVGDQCQHCQGRFNTTAGLLQQWFDKFCRVYITSASVIKDYHEARFRMAKIEKCVRLLELH